MGTTTASRRDHLVDTALKLFCNAATTWSTLL
jgi:hypothetical protein